MKNVENDNQGHESGDRRRGHRADASGVAVIHAPGIDLRCGISDLSLGGGRFLSQRSDELPAGTPVTVELGIQGADWVQETGVVLRQVGDEVVIGFALLSRHAAEIIALEVIDDLEARQTPRIILVDRLAARRQVLATALECAGFRAIEASTPLEAIDIIERSRTHVAIAAIHESLTQTDGLELASFLEETHPSVKIAIIGEGGGTRMSLSVDRSDDPIAPIRHLLARA